MKAQLTISGNEFFTIRLTPETEAEREILARVGECKDLTSADRLRKPGDWRNDSDCLEIMRHPPRKEPARPLCEHGYNGSCPTCSTMQTPPMMNDPA